LTTTLLSTTLRAFLPFRVAGLSASAIVRSTPLVPAATGGVLPLAVRATLGS